jgi:hypothetical protein
MSVEDRNTYVDTQTCLSADKSTGVEVWISHSGILMKWDSNDCSLYTLSVKGHTGASIPVPLTESTYNGLLATSTGRTVETFRNNFRMREGGTLAICRYVVPHILCGELVVEVELPTAAIAASFVAPTGIGPEIVNAAHQAVRLLYVPQETTS